MQMQCCNNKLLLISATTTSNDSPQFKSNKIKIRFQYHNTNTSLVHIPKAYQHNNASQTLPLPPNVKSITSTSNPFVKHCVKLRQNSSYRHSHTSVLVVGITPISEICSFPVTFSDRPIIECLIVLENYDIPEEIDKHVIRVVRVSSVVIKKISGVQSIDSVEAIALVRIPSNFRNISSSLHEEDCRTWFSFPNRVLVLDGIQDPGNLGTLLRSAVAFRWGGIFLLPGCCDPFNDKALRACRGACFQIPIVCGNWTHVENLREAFGMKMYAGHPASGNMSQVIKLSKDFADSVADLPLCLVLGSEGNGLSEISKKCCELVSIPMAGDFESLNVSVAGGILMYMLQRENDRDV